NIIITSLPYLDPANYSGTGGTPAPTLARHLDFNQATLDISNTNNTKYADIYNAVKNNGGAFGIADNLHPNNYGHRVIALAVAQVAVDPVLSNGQQLIVNGVSEFNDVRL